MWDMHAALDGGSLRTRSMLIPDTAMVITIAIFLVAT
jgi:hypothetical protein